MISKFFQPIFSLAIAFYFSIPALQAQEEEINLLYDDSYRADELLKRGDTFIQQDLWDEAISTFLRAENRFEKNESWEKYIYALGKIGYSYRRKFQYDSAKYFLFKARELAYSHLGGEHPELGRVYFYLSYYYERKPQADPDSALFSLKESLRIRQASLPDLHLDIAESYHGIGGFYIFSNPPIAIENFLMAIKIKEELLGPYSPEIANSYQFLGTSYSQLGDYHRAGKYLSLAVRIHENNPNANLTLKSIAYTSLGNSYFYKKNFEKATGFYKKAIDIDINVRGYDSTEVMLDMGNLAQSYLFSGKPDSAELIYKRLLDINPKSSTFEYEIYAYHYFQLGIVYSETDNLEKARKAFIYSLGVYKDVLNMSGPDVGDLYSYLGHVDIKEGRFEAGLNNFQLGLINLEDDFENLDINSNPTFENSTNLVLLYMILVAKAEALFNSYQGTGDDSYLNSSILLYAYIDELSDFIKNGPFTENLKLDIGARIKKSTDNALTAISEFTDITENKDYESFAFELMEKSRYSQTYTTLARSEAFSNSNLPDSIYLSEKRFTYKIRSMEEKIEGESNATNKSVLKDSLFLVERDYQIFQEFLLKNYATYYQIKYDSLMLSDKDIQSLIEPETQILEYFWGESAIFIYSITQKSSEFIQVIKTEQIASQINQLKRILSTVPELSNSLEDLYKQYSSPAYGIYDILVGPFIELDTKRLIISGDGPISTIPFEALLTDDNPSTFASALYLIRDIDLQYSYSSNLLFKNKNIVPLENPTILALGYSDASESSSSSGRTGYEEIPESAFEVKNISKVFGKSNGNYITGDDATESAFKQLSPDSNILHLAVHGEGNADEALESRLIFKTSADSLNDGDLYAYELYNLDLSNIRLAVLSACETGLGEEHPGEGILSMARGFAYAGCPSTIMSLWRVNDASTARIMSLFYENISKGMEISEAIRQAKLMFISSESSAFALPHFWAGFVPMGSSGSS